MALRGQIRRLSVSCRQGFNESNALVAKRKPLYRSVPADSPHVRAASVKDITEWSERWSTPLGTMDAHAPVADGVLVDLSLCGTSIIGLAVQCPDGKYFGSLRASRNVYDRVLEFLKRNHGRKLRELMDAEIDISDVIQ